MLIQTEAPPALTLPPCLADRRRHASRIVTHAYQAEAGAAEAVI